MNNKTAVKLWDSLVQDINGTPSPFAIAAIANGVIPTQYPIEFNWDEAANFLREFASALDLDKKTPKPMEPYNPVISAPPKFYSPLHTPSNWQIPKTQNEKHAWYNLLAHTNPKSAAFLDIITYRCSEAFGSTKLNMDYIHTFLYDFCKSNNMNNYNRKYKDPNSWIEYNNLIERFAYEYFIHGILCIKDFNIIKYSDIKANESNAFIVKRTTNNLLTTIYNNERFDTENGISIFNINFESDKSVTTHELYLYYLNIQLNRRFKPYLDNFNTKNSNEQFDLDVEVSTFLAALNQAAKEFYNNKHKKINKIGITKDKDVLVKKEDRRFTRDTFKDEWNNYDQ